MSQKEQKLFDEIRWHLNLETRQIWAMSIESNEALNKIKGTILELIKEANIEIKLQTEDKEKQRYSLILEIEEPTWAFIFKLKSDNWDYIEYLEGLKELI